MPTLNLDVVTGATIDVEKELPGGERKVWKLRADVPSSVLVRCFYLLELDQHRPQLEIDMDAPLDFEAVKDLEARIVAHEEQEADETLAICGAIWRHTDPAMTDVAIEEMLTHNERRALVTAFFTLLLARYGKLPPSATSGSSPTASSETTEETAGTQEGQTPGLEVRSSLSSKAADSIPSATLSPAASSSPLYLGHEKQEAMALRKTGKISRKA